MDSNHKGEFAADFDVTATTDSSTAIEIADTNQVEDAFVAKSFDTQWGDENLTFDSAEDWVKGKKSGNEESPVSWDPTTFDQQAPSSWKEPPEPKRIQDLPSQLLVEPEPNLRRSDSDEQWPFKNPCRMEEQRKKRMTPKTEAGSASDIDSEEEHRSNGDNSVPEPDQEKAVPTVSADSEEDDDIAEDTDIAEDVERLKSEAPKRRNSSSKRESASSDVSKDGSSSRRGRRKDHDPSMPRRSRAGRPDADELEPGEPPSKPMKTDGDVNDEEVVEEVDRAAAVETGERPRKPRRRGSQHGSSEEAGESLNQGSFHKLAKDFDKKQSRSSSAGRKSRTPSGSSRRRRVKDRSLDVSGHSTGGGDDAGEFEEDDHEVKLKGDSHGTPGSGGRRSRERRGLSRGGQPVLQAPGSGGRRPPTSRRSQMRRASSERWMRTVEGVDMSFDGPEIGRSRADSSELSRSAHGIKRFHSGGAGRLSAGLGTSSYHGTDGGSSGRRTPSRRAPRKAMHTPNSDASGGGSFGEDYEYEMNLSGRSSRTLDSIEDLEDFEHIDFQTPGMVDYDEEILELMQRANPEHTAQLQRRVARKREAVNYDQNMPMMTRQALMTRTASTQVQRQFVDQSTIDRRNLMVRSMSSSSMASSTEELSLSQHRQQFSRGGPSRRPPPRTRSSGMAAALSRSEHPYGHGPPRPSEDDRRRVPVRTKSSTSTSTFRYNQKPNRVQSLSRRPGAAEGLDNSRRGANDDPRGSLSRAQSMHASLERAGGPRSLSPKKPERRVPKSIDTKHGKESPVRGDSKDEDSSVSECSDVESDDDDESVSSDESPERPVRRKIPIKLTPPKPIPALQRKKTDKRDFTVKRNRSKLHAMLYETKMGVDMKDLLKQVQRGEVPRSPIKTLMMPSP